MRPLSPFEIKMLRPEISEYLRAAEKAREAKDRLERIVALIGGEGSRLHLSTLMLESDERERKGGANDEEKD